ncbi:mitochondrial carrier domain-containing protein [Lipomyces arxii]|uniref:mitochondrial carrier domain-containing protein n=1 Tax=Lipomyces arxii TaxID=56418 RepID=UPI0034CE66B1
MDTSVSPALSQPSRTHSQSSRQKHQKGYVGFIAGMGSGFTKILVGHPLDTLKVRLQTSSKEQFKGPIDCLVKTFRNEGPLALYKGATAPLIGWIAVDSVQLGSQQLYRKAIHQHFYSSEQTLPTLGVAFAGLFGGLSVTTITAPVEHIKARLQVQYNASTKLYTGTIDCGIKLYKQAGLFNGIYHGFFSSLLFRTRFFFYWAYYDVMTKYAKGNTTLSTAAISFWAGGFSAQAAWLFGLPFDVVKQVIMTDSIANPQHKTYMAAVRFVYNKRGLSGFYRGLVPSMMRAFPANAASLTVFEAVMRYM